MSSPFSIPGAKLTLVIALAMTTLGFVGLLGSLEALTRNIDDLAFADPAAPVAVAEAGEAFFRAFAGSPLRRALTVANVLASGLLLVASFLLTGRARSAPWWASQALWANVLYTVGAGVGNAYLIHAHRPQLLAFLRAVVEAESAAAPLPDGGVESIPVMIVAVTIFMHVVLAGLYLLLLRGTKRNDVVRFVTRDVERG